MTADLDREARELLARYPRPAGALLPLIDLVQVARGDCDADAADWIASLTGLTAAAVAGIASSRGGGQADAVRVCTGLSCRLMGADVILERLRAASGARLVSSDCLGVCHAAPAIELAGRVHDGLTAERLDHLIGGNG